MLDTRQAMAVSNADAARPADWVGVGARREGDCSFFDGWRDQPEGEIWPRFSSFRRRRLFGQWAFLNCSWWCRVVAAGHDRPIRRGWIFDGLNAAGNRDEGIAVGCAGGGRVI
jgi:hypothetical protein